MPVDTFIDFVARFGLPLTFTIVALMAFKKRWIITIEEYNEMRKKYTDDYNSMVVEKDAQIKDAKASTSEMWGIVRANIKITDAALSASKESGVQR